MIHEVILNPIPGFRGGQTLTPNWALASTTFDTTPYSDTYLVFWVVVWMEQNGQLVSEMPGHGITAIPGAMTPPLLWRSRPTATTWASTNSPSSSVPRTPARRRVR